LNKTNRKAQRPAENRYLNGRFTSRPSEFGELFSGLQHKPNNQKVPIRYGILLSSGTFAVILQQILRFIRCDRAAQDVQQGPGLLVGFRNQLRSRSSVTFSSVVVGKSWTRGSPRHLPEPSLPQSRISKRALSSSSFGRVYGDAYLRLWRHGLDVKCFLCEVSSCV
jgi:hypothetical protein